MAREGRRQPKPVQGSLSSWLKKPEVVVEEETTLIEVSLTSDIRPLAPIFQKGFRPQSKLHPKDNPKADEKKTEKKNGKRLLSTPKEDKKKKQKIVINLSDDEPPSKENNNHYDSETDLDPYEDTIDFETARSNRLENEIINNCWSEKYRPKSGSEMIGQEEAVSTFSGFLKDFTRKGRIDQSDHSDEDELTNLKLESEDWVGAQCLLVTGKHGVGKTSLVHAVGRDFNMKVFEMNASSKRSGKILMESLHEATQSHHLRGSSIPPVNAITNFFKKVVPAVTETPKPQSHISSNTIILLDDVDIIFDQQGIDGTPESSEGNNVQTNNSEGDEGFWRSLRSLIRDSKVPIVLTATRFIQDVLFEKLKDIEVFRIHMESPLRSLQPIRERLLNICSDELSHQVDDFESPELTDRVNDLIIDSNFDIRKCLNNIQFHGPSFFKVKTITKTLKRRTDKRIRNLATYLDDLSFCDCLPRDKNSFGNEFINSVNEELVNRIKSQSPISVKPEFKSIDDHISKLCWSNELSAVIGSIIDASGFKPMNHTASNVTLDLIPWIHLICQSEDVKAKVAKEEEADEPLKKTRRLSRRRFLHYFDQSNFFLDPPDKIFLSEGVYKSFPETETFNGEEEEDAFNNSLANSSIVLDDSLQNNA